MIITLLLLCALVYVLHIKGVSHNSSPIAQAVEIAKGGEL